MTLTERIYESVPLPIQNALISAKGAEFRILRQNSSRIRQHLRALQESERWTSQDFESYQIERLRSTLRDAFAHVPYYRALAHERGLSAESFRSLSDLRRLPVLEKADLRGKEDSFLDERFAESHRLLKGSTSGTTGTPLRIIQTPESFSARMAYVGRLRTWAGVDPLFPWRAQFTGRDIVPRSQSPEMHVYWRHNVAGRAVLFSTSHLSEATAPAYAAKLCAMRPELIDGYPSALAVLARLAHAGHLKLPRVRAVITTAETLFPEDRAIIQSGFGAPVFDQYAASEPSCFWSNCEHGRMHVHPEYGISEIIGPDGEPSGEGEVVLTSFLNPAMPLIRYRVGDRAQVARDQTCPCGRAMPVMQTVQGRTDDVLFFPGRGFVGRMDPIFKGLTGILEAQIVQEQLNVLRIRIVAGLGYDESVERDLVDHVHSKIGEEPEVIVETVREIKRGPNGKFRAVVTLVRDQYPASVVTPNAPDRPL